MTMNTSDSLPLDVAPGARWLARLGVWGFAFFAVKGLAWLIIPLIAMVLA